MKNASHPTPIRVIKSGESVKVSSTQIAAFLQSPETMIKSKTNASAKVEPQVQLMEVSPGVFDLIFTCSCGQKSTIHCESVEK